MAKKSKAKLSALSTAAVVTLSLMAVRQAGAVTANLNMQAEILSSFLAVTSTQGLDFGAVIAGGGVGSVKIDTAGLPTYGVVTPIVSQIPSEAIMKVFGTTGKIVTLSVTKPTFTVSNGTSTMKVSQFQIQTNAGGGLKTFALSAGTMPVPVGATLAVGAAQPTGTYKGAFTVKAVYQ